MLPNERKQYNTRVQNTFLNKKWQLILLVTDFWFQTNKVHGFTDISSELNWWRAKTCCFSNRHNCWCYKNCSQIIHGRYYQDHYSRQPSIWLGAHQNYLRFLHLWGPFILHRPNLSTKYLIQYLLNVRSRTFVFWSLFCTFWQRWINQFKCIAFRDSCWNAEAKRFSPSVLNARILTSSERSPMTKYK